jgi:hypothetical protein
VRVPPVRTQAAHGTADRRSRALDVSTEAEQRSQIAYRGRELAAKLGAVSGQTIIFDERLIGCLEGTDEGIAACRASKKCGYCGTYFLPKHGKAKFCSDAHRQRYHHNGAMERPVFRCDELAPPLRWATPTLVDLGSPHDVRCLWRRKAIAETFRDFCTCGMTFEKAVTIRIRFGAKNRSIYSKYEGGKAMAAQKRQRIQ